jgi:predicted aldo/keto reductase-like oxidoreductase
MYHRPEKETTMSNSERHLKRRSFLQLGAAGLAALSVKPAAGSGPGRQSSAAPSGSKLIPRTLGKTGIKLPVVSMGVMNSDNPNLIRAALDRGIVLLDTAHGYQRGRNEVIIGEAIKGRPRDSYVIATKVPAEPTTEAYLKNVEISLERLGLEHVDILNCHDVSSRREVEFEPVLKALEKLKKDGRARFVGVTTHSNEPEVIRAAAESKFHDVVITAYNFRQSHREQVREAVDTAAKAGVGIIAMKTLAGRYWDKERKQPINTTAALKWVLNDPNVTTAIPGMTTFDQLEADLAVMTALPLTEQEKNDLRLNADSAGLYCQQCGQCLRACREHLPVPSLMRSYMYAYGYGNLSAAHDLLRRLDLPDQPCRNCGDCSVRCVQGIDVADRVKDIAPLRSLPDSLFALTELSKP